MGQEPRTVGAGYSGLDSLEVMEDAVTYNNFLAELVFAQIKPGDTIVDFGAGIGTMASKVAKAGHHVICVEPDEEQAARIARSGLTVVRSVDELRDEGADYIYTLNVLEHIEDDRIALQRLYQKLRPSGRLLIYVPAFEELFSSMDRKVGHYRRYRMDALLTLLQSAKFEVMHSRYIDSIGFLAALVYKFIAGNSGTINRRTVVFYDRVLFPLSRMADRVFERILGKNLLIIARKY